MGWFRPLFNRRRRNGLKVRRSSSELRDRRKDRDHCVVDLDINPAPVLDNAIGRHENAFDIRDIG